MSAAPVPLLRIENLQRSYGGVAAVAGASFDVARRIDHGAHRPERGRQDDRLRPHQRLSATPRRGNPLPGTLIGGLAPERIAGGPRAHLPADPHLHVMTVLDNMLVAAQGGRAVVAAAAAPSREAGRSRGRGAGARDPRPFRTWRDQPATSRAASPAGSASCSSSRAPDGRAAACSARRAHGRRQPHARLELLEHIQEMRAGRDHLPLHRARPGGRDGERPST